MKAGAKRQRGNPPAEAIRLAPANASGADGLRWGTMLVIFMRIIALLWMFKGLMQWRLILAPEDGVSLDGLPPLMAAAVAFFAVADLLAAVGLWLAASWGGILWLFTAIIGILSTLVLHELPSSRVATGVDLALIVVYFALTWYAARENED